MFSTDVCTPGKCVPQQQHRNLRTVPLASQLLMWARYLAHERWAQPSLFQFHFHQWKSPHYINCGNHKITSQDKLLLTSSFLPPTPFKGMSVICFRREYCASEQAWCSGKYECIHKEFLGAHINMNFLSIHIGPRTTLKTCMYIFTYIHIHLHTHSHLHSQMREEIATVLDRKAV